jgi:YgiT-type zinc finger domain-containing protein
MKCVICRNGELAPGTATITRQIGGTTLVLKDVPALVCDNCGEEYLDDETTDAVHALTKRHERSGAEVVVAAYHAAA